MEEGCEIEISGGSKREREGEGKTVGEVEVERDGASVAAVIKLRAVGQAGSSASLMSVCSVCSVVLPCGLLLKRRPTMDEACPLCAFVLYGT